MCKAKLIMITYLWKPRVWASEPLKKIKKGHWTVSTSMRRWFCHFIHHVFDCPHLTSEKTEAQKSTVTGQGHTAKWCRAEARTQTLETIPLPPHHKHARQTHRGACCVLLRDPPRAPLILIVFANNKMRLRDIKSPAQDHPAIHIGACM